MSRAVALAHGLGVVDSLSPVTGTTGNKLPAENRQDQPRFRAERTSPSGTPCKVRRSSRLSAFCRGRRAKFACTTACSIALLDVHPATAQANAHVLVPDAVLLCSRSQGTEPQKSTRATRLVFARQASDVFASTGGLVGGTAATARATSEHSRGWRVVCTREAYPRVPHMHSTAKPSTFTVHSILLSASVKWRSLVSTRQPPLTPSKRKPAIGAWWLSSSPYLN